MLRKRLIYQAQKNPFKQDNWKVNWKRLFYADAELGVFIPVLLIPTATEETFLVKVNITSASSCMPNPISKTFTRFLEHL